MTSEPAIERRLGPSEECLWRLDRASSLNCVAHVEVAGPLAEAHVRQGLELLQRRHFLLRVRIAGRARLAPWFRSGVPPIPLRVLDCTANQWAAEVEDELNTRLPAARGPLARAVWLRHSDEISTLLLAFHHVIGDGRTAVFLTRDWLTVIGAAARGASSSLPPLSPEPPYQQRFPSHARGLRGCWAHGRLLGQIIGDLRRSGALTLLQPDGAAPLAERRMRSLPYVFDVPVTQALVAAARREGTTVYGALGAALAIAAAHDTRADAFQPVRMLFGCAVNMRDRLEPPIGETCGYAASGVGAFPVVAADTTFWELARWFKDDLEQRLARNEHFVLLPQRFHAYALLGRLCGAGSKAAARFGRMLDTLHPKGILLSNVGRVELAGAYGPLVVRSWGLAAAMSALGMLGSMAATCNDTLVWHIGAMEPLIRLGRLRAIADRAVTLLTDAAGTTSGAGR
ncbi:MAG: hypothetical protein JXA69_05920 [Phycisphaerae bacterium]|nr:hypothetical protein [Phycisphaerae bacterium]